MRTVARRLPGANEGNAMKQVSGVLLSIAVWASPAFSAEEPESGSSRGVIRQTAKVSPGYTLISPFASTTTFLINAEGEVLHTWESKYEPGLFPYLLPNGNLLRGIQLDLPVRHRAGGSAGGLQEFTWDGELVWEFHFASDEFFYHHDTAPMTNGNILMIAWGHRTKEEALSVGRLPTWSGDDGLYPAMIVEIEPLRPYGARVVWEWHVWDHLIQDVDPSLPNFGVVRNHPERVNINGDVPREQPDDDSAISDDELNDLAALGYLGGAGGDEGLDDEDKRNRERGDWLHLNGIDYNPELDQIVVSSWHMNEIWVIDHSTTTEEARGSTGGRSGKGGDLLYRWGNPQVWQLGTEDDRVLFHQHDARWIPPGYPGAGNLTIFNNGRKRPEEEYSTVLEIVPPLGPDGNYLREAYMPFEPMEPVWKYDPPEDERFYASFISGAHRLQNGNTLVCSGPDGRVLEVTPQGDVAWEYRQPFGEPPGGEIEDANYAMFRATRIPPEHPALSGRDLTPLDPQPKTMVQLSQERPALAEEASGWQPLIDEARGRGQPWANGTLRQREDFLFEDDPDDDSERVFMSGGAHEGFIRTEKMFENFIAEFEWRDLDEPTDAGFLIWCDSLPHVGSPMPRGIEVQLSAVTGNDSPAVLISHGGAELTIDGMSEAEDPVAKQETKDGEETDEAARPGEWKLIRITAIDGALRIEQNGKTVATATRGSPSRGYLGLAVSQGEVHFRESQIWELSSGTHRAEGDRVALEGIGEFVTPSELLEEETVRTGEWTVEGRTLVSGEESATLSLELPEESRGFQFDFSNSASAAILPVQWGKLSWDELPLPTEEWARVVVSWNEAEIVLECGGVIQKRALEGADFDSVTLLGGGNRRFCNFFVRRKD